MAGGLMQLVAYGAQDVYLTGDPKVTFFNSVYKRHTSFAMEAIKLTLQGSVGNGNLIQVVVGRDGDMIGDMWVELAPILSAPPVWLAERAFKSIELTIGGQRIDKHYQLWFRLWSEVFRGESQKLTYGKLSSLGNSTADSSTPNVVNLPLLFFFNRDPGLFLPLIALQYHEVRIIFELADDYLSYFSTNYFTLWGNYMFLDVKERKMFATKSHEYLIEQVQHNGGDVVTPGILKPSFRMPYQHPVKELLWCFQNPTVTGSNMWNFCVDTANVYTTTSQISNIAPHCYGSPIISTSSTATGTTYDAGTSITSAAQGQFGYSTAISSTGTAYAVGAPNSRSAIANNATAGSAKVYSFTNGAWDTGSSLNPSTDPATGSLYGTSVAISPDGTQAVVGAPGTTNGNIYGFKYVNNVWNGWQTAAGSASSVKFGTSVAITNGGIVAAGAPAKATNTGEVLVYNINNISGYTAVGSAVTGLGNLNDNVGTSVALDSTGTILAIGAPQVSSAGTALGSVSGADTTVLTYGSTTNTLGTLLLTITGSVTGTMTIGGTRIATGQTYYLVGTNATTATLYAIGTDGSELLPALTISSGTTTGATFTVYGMGYAKIYRFAAGAWTPDTTNAMFGTKQSLFGTSLSLNAAGNILAVGAPGTSTASGYVKVFTYNGSAWSLATTITASSTSDTFGTSVSLNPAGTSLAIGSPSIGYVNVYQSTAGVWSARSAYNYTDSTSNMNFGQSVALSQNLMIGAPALSSAATPVNYVKLYSTIIPYKTWVEEGGETATVTTGPLSSFNVDLNGQSRFFPQTGKYFNQYQPLMYHSGSPYPGIYSYSFALKPELHQPSGTCNFSRIDNSQVNIILKNSMYTPCNFKLFAVNYNILRVQAGMSGLAFSN